MKHALLTRKKIYSIVAISMLPLAHASESISHQSSNLIHKTSRPLLNFSQHDININVNGRLKDDFMFFNSVRTLRNDYQDQHNFVRHRFDLNVGLTQGVKKHGAPLSEAQFQLTNYIYWQQHGRYTPFTQQDIKTSSFDQTIVAQQVSVKTLMPLLFVEQAWFALHLDKCIENLRNLPAMIKIGFFKYQVGRGIALGYHDDMAVDYLGWPGEDRHTRYPHMPPGVLLHLECNSKLSADLYWMKWTSVGSDLENTLAPTRAQRLDVGPSRGVHKDRYNLVCKLDYQPNVETIGKLLIQPYVVYTKAPEQAIEFEADASSQLFTIGAMFDGKKGNFEYNIEFAGQFGHQNLYSIDRNTVVLQHGTPTFSHIVYDQNDGTTHVPVRTLNTATALSYSPMSDDIAYVVNMPHNRDISRQGEAIKEGINTTANLLISKNNGLKQVGGAAIYNAHNFGNARFRPGYKLNYQGFMALADIRYTCDKWPYSFTGAAGYISGDQYPYNEEINKTYRGFVPMRSRYEGYFMDNFLIFDRLMIPRPLNISHRTMFAHNNTKDLSNLQFIGLGTTWYPLENRNKCIITTNIWTLWEVAQLKSWDPYGKHPHAQIEKEIAYQRASLGFPGVPRQLVGAIPATNRGWVSSKNASKHLGVELDIKATYHLLQHAHCYALFSLFMPGKLYKDLQGQPNNATRRIDNQGLSNYDSLGSEPAFAAVIGLNYKF